MEKLKTEEKITISKLPDCSQAVERVINIVTDAFERVVAKYLEMST